MTEAILQDRQNCPLSRLTILGSISNDHQRMGLRHSGAEISVQAIQCGNLAQMCYGAPNLSKLEIQFPLLKLHGQNVGAEISAPKWPRRNVLGPQMIPLKG